MTNVLKTVGIVLGVLLATTQLWDWGVRLLGGELEAEVRFGKFVVPPVVEEDLDRFHQIADAEAFLAAAEREGVLRNPDDLESRLLSLFLGAFSEHVQNGLRELRIVRLHQLSGYWDVKISNNRSSSVDNVSVILPWARYVEIAQDGKATLFKEVSGVVELGALRPAESVSVLAWTSRDISEHIAGDARAVHDSGVAKTVVFAEVGTVGRVAERHWPLLLYMLFGLSLLAWFGWSSFKLAKTLEAQTTERSGT